MIDLAVEVEQRNADRRVFEEAFELLLGALERLHPTEVYKANDSASPTPVTDGENVDAGQNLGMSGNTGCSTVPHLHFAMFRWVELPNGDEQWVTVDPYGWAGALPDPWSQHAEGATSILLWEAGQAPTLVLQ